MSLTRTSCGRRRGRRDRPSRSRATRGSRTRRRSRRSGPSSASRVPALEPVVRAVGHVRVELARGRRWYSAMNVGVVEEPRPVDRAREDRDRVAVARPGRRASIRLNRSARPRMPRPPQVVGEAAQALRAGAAARNGAPGSVGTSDEDSMGGHDTGGPAIRPSRLGCERGRRAPRDASRTLYDAAMPLRVAFIAAECEPWAKTGGLGDVVDALARALGRLPTAGAELDGPGRRVPAALPRRAGARRPTPPRPTVSRPGPARAGGRSSTSRSSTSRPTATGSASSTIPAAFDRDGFYGDAAATTRQRLAVRAVLPGGARGPRARTAAPVDVLHLHDWHTGPAALLARPCATRDDPVVGAGRDRHHAPQPRLPRLDAARARSASSGLAPGDGLVARGRRRASTCCATGIERAELVNTVSPGLRRARR